MDDLRIAISFGNNVAAVRITEGRCTVAIPLLDQALKIQQDNADKAALEGIEAAEQKALSAIAESAGQPGSVASPPDRSPSQTGGS